LITAAQKNDGKIDLEVIYKNHQMPKYFTDTNHTTKPTAYGINNLLCGTATQPKLLQYFKNADETQPGYFVQTSLLTELLAKEPIAQPTASAPIIQQLPVPTVGVDWDNVKFPKVVAANPKYIVAQKSISATDKDVVRSLFFSLHRAPDSGFEFCESLNQNVYYLSNQNVYYLSHLVVFLSQQYNETRSCFQNHK
jgi:hypothetical protein